MILYVTDTTNPIAYVLCLISYKQSVNFFRNLSFPFQHFPTLAFHVETNSAGSSGISRSAAQSHSRGKLED